MLLLQMCMIILCLKLSLSLNVQQFFVGAILSPDDDETEVAFRTAVYQANTYERAFELIPIIEYVKSDDSLSIEKSVCHMVAQGALTIFGTKTSTTSDVIASICSTLDIPHIVFDWSPNESIEDRDHFTMSLSFYPENILLSRGVAELLQTFGWRSYTVVYETENDLRYLQEVLQANEPNSNPSTIKQLGSNGDFRPFLKSIKLSTENCMVLLCSIDNIIPILRQADELNMLGEYQSVFIPVLDSHTLSFQELQNVGANITTISLIDPAGYHIQSIKRDLEKFDQKDNSVHRRAAEPFKTSMILLTDAVWILMRSLSELVRSEKIEAPSVECRKNRQWPFGKRLIDLMKARTDEGATGRISFDYFGKRNFFTVQCMEITKEGFDNVAVWDPVNGFTKHCDDEESNKKVVEKIQKKTFIITSRIGAPFLSMRQGELLAGNARYEGYSMDLIDAIANLLNFKYEFKLAPDGKYGSFNKHTQEWDGLVKELLNGNADLGICDLTMTSARRQAVDFTPPFMTLGISILFAKPDPPPQNLFSFLSPFSLDVWIYMATAYLGVSLLLYALSRMAPDDWENSHPCKEPEEVENIWSIVNTTWLTMGSIMGQGCDILPKAASTRMVTGMWWFFALMMLNSYTANLAAFLTMSRMDSSIESAEDLAAQSKIKYGAVMGGSTMSFFKDSNFSTYQRMWASMESATPSVFTKSNDEGVERVIKGKRLYAYLMESTSLEYIIERNCELMQVGGWLDYKTYGIAMPFNSPYRKQISRAVLKLGELGTLAELKRKWWKEMHGGGRCSQTEDGASDTPELDLKNVGGVFLVLGIGLISAIALGIFEFLWNVRSVAVDEKVTLVEAIRSETLFALQFWLNTKPVHTSSGSTSSHCTCEFNTNSKRSSKSLALSSAHGLKAVKNEEGATDIVIHE